MPLLLCQFFLRPCATACGQKRQFNTLLHEHLHYSAYGAQDSPEDDLLPAIPDLLQFHADKRHKAIAVQIERGSRGVLLCSCDAVTHARQSAGEVLTGFSETFRLWVRDASSEICRLLGGQHISRCLPLPPPSPGAPSHFTGKGAIPICPGVLGSPTCPRLASPLCRSARVQAKAVTRRSAGRAQVVARADLRKQVWATGSYRGQRIAPGCAEACRNGAVSEAFGQVQCQGAETGRAGRQAARASRVGGVG